VNADAPQLKRLVQSRFRSGVARSAPGRTLPVPGPRYSCRYVAGQARELVHRAGVRTFSDDAVRRPAGSVSTYAQSTPVVRRLVGSVPFPGIDKRPARSPSLNNGNVPDVSPGTSTSSDNYPRDRPSLTTRTSASWSTMKTLRARNPPHPSGATEYHRHPPRNEFSHLVHWNNAPNEDTWIKEGVGGSLS
jgi:hypothetical protein